MFTKPCHLSLSWSRQIQSTLSHLMYLRSNLISSSHLHLGLPCGLSFRFPPNLAHILPPPTPYVPHNTHVILLAPFTPICDQYRSWRSSSCNFLQPLITSWAQTPSSASQSPTHSEYELTTHQLHEVQWEKAYYMQLVSVDSKSLSSTCCTLLSDWECGTKSASYMWLHIATVVFSTASGDFLFITIHNHNHTCLPVSTALLQQVTHSEKMSCHVNTHMNPVLQCNRWH